MDKTGFRFVVLLLISGLALIVVHSEGNRKYLETLFGNKVWWVSPDEHDQELVEQMWIHCWKKIDYSSIATPDFRLNLPSELGKAINNLPTKAQKSLLDCLTRKNLLLDTPNNDPISTTWLEKFLDRLSDFSIVPRRILKGGRHRKKSKKTIPFIHKKHPRNSHEQESDDLPLRENPHKSHKQDTHDLTLDKSHKQDSDDLTLHESHKQDSDDLTLHKGQKEDTEELTAHKSYGQKTDDLIHHKSHKQDSDDLTPHKSHKQDSDDLTIHKSQKEDTEELTAHKSYRQKTDDLIHHKSHKQDYDDLTPHKSHKQNTDDLTSHKSHKQETEDLSLHKSHKQETEDLTPHKSHKQETEDLTLHKKLPDQTQKPKADDLTPHKNPPHQHHEPKDTTFTIHKDPESSSTYQSALPKLLASAPRPMLLAPSRTPTSTPASSHVPASAPAPTHISPEPSTASSPVPIPSSSDTSPPPLVDKPPPAQDVPDTIPIKSEDGTHRYIIISSVAGVVVLLALLALFLVCCIKRGKNKVDPEEGQRSENALGDIGMSNIPGAAEKTKDEENPNNNILNNTNFTNNQTFNTETSLENSPESPQSKIDTPPPIPPPPAKKAPPPPPPKRPSAPPPPPPKGTKAPPAPLGKPLVNNRGKKSSLGGANDDGGSDSSNKARLKPFFWDKVSPDQSMVWQDLKAGSFQVDEKMMETLFGYTVSENTKIDERKTPTPYNSPPQFIKIIDPKKAQNLSILLKALNVTTKEVCDALKEGNELPSELIQNLTKMAPTTEEELKLRLYEGELSMLGPAERFLKSVVEIPFAFKRMESLLFMTSVQEEVSSINDSFKTLEVACTELKNSRLFLKLLEAVLKTGNRMNDGTYRGDAQAFKLDTLLKLSDVKGTDGKTTLLHFVVQEIIKSEGIRSARKLRETQSMSSVMSEDLNDDSTPDSAEYYRSLGLNVVLNLSSDLENVRKAALIDGDAVTNAVYKLGSSLSKIKNFLESEMEGLEKKCEFSKKLEDFVISTDDEIKRLIEEEKRITELVKRTADYFYGKRGKNEGLRMYVIVADFLVVLEKVCKEVKSKEKTMPMRAQRREALSPSSSTDSTISVEQNDIRKRLFPVITAIRNDASSSDDDSFSP